MSVQDGQIIFKKGKWLRVAKVGDDVGFIKLSRAEVRTHLAEIHAREQAVHTTPPDEPEEGGISKARLL